MHENPQWNRIALSKQVFHLGSQRSEQFGTRAEWRPLARIFAPIATRNNPCDCRNPNEVDEECKPSEITLLPAAMMQLFTIEPGWHVKRERISRRIGTPRFLPGSPLVCGQHCRFARNGTAWQGCIRLRSAFKCHVKDCRCNRQNPG